MFKMKDKLFDNNHMNEMRPVSAIRRVRLIASKKKKIPLIVKLNLC